MSPPASLPRDLRRAPTHGAPGRFAWLVLLVACSSRTSHAPAEGSPAASSAPGQTDAATEAQRKACLAPPCGSPLTRLIVYRDAQQAIRRYEAQGSPASCSHPPTLFLDERGEETGAIPMVPVVPGSEEQKRFDEIRATQTAGLHRAEELRCDRFKKP